ncbi:MAG TPA: hypothetical protein EYG16_09000 [Deltaproteobacteria bacterium]|nr:hypothetical protein [Candidatus Binatota bacterium]HIL13793.1 hypothetical protein [Deltaproteobacteria bacterium]
MYSGSGKVALCGRIAGAAVGLLLLFSGPLVQPRAAAAAGFSILNADFPDSGLNDPTVLEAVPGSSAGTLGEQRLDALRYAAGLWEETLANEVEIVLRVRFVELGGTLYGAVLGSAAAMTVHRDFAGAPLSSTYYPAALANNLAGLDLNGGIPEIWITFNASLDRDAVLGERSWYYGHDGEVPCGPRGCDIDLVSVALHEIAHGLGFTTLFDYGSGEKFDSRLRCPGMGLCSLAEGCANGACLRRGYDDRYLLQLIEAGTGNALSTMTSADRASVLVSDGGLAWSGDELARASVLLNSGVDVNGDVHMHDPARLAPGSSVTHFSPALSPDQFMEPGYTGPIHDTDLPGGLAAYLLADLGWSLRGKSRCGDADGSGQVGIADALTVLRSALGLPGSCPLSACDVNGDQKISVVDALLILSLVVGNPVSFDCSAA